MAVACFANHCQIAVHRLSDHARQATSRDLSPRPSGQKASDAIAAAKARSHYAAPLQTSRVRTAIAARPPGRQLRAASGGSTRLTVTPGSRSWHKPGARSTPTAPKGLKIVFMGGAQSVGASGPICR